MLQTKQYTVIIIALMLIGSAYFLGNTTYPLQKIAAAQQAQLTIETLLTKAAEPLNAKQKEHAAHLASEVIKTTSDSAKAITYNELLAFWGSEVKNDEIAIYYVAEKAKLENSEKNLTFAANLILDNCINNNTDQAKKGFKANIAKSLFEKAIILNPNNDSLQVGLGGCYMFGAGGTNPMEGISKVLGVIQKDSTNAYAQKMLGYGNLQNGQLDKAAGRFEKAYLYNNNDIGLVPYLALLYKKLGNKEAANMWYIKAKEVFVTNKQVLQEFEKEYQTPLNK